MNKRIAHTGLSLMLAVVMSFSLILPKMGFAKDTQYNPKVSFVFSDTAISESGTGDGYEIENTALTITKSGTYAVSGSCANGSITVKKDVKDVNLVLDGLTLSADDTTPISIHKSSAVNLIIKENTDNYLSDTEKNNDEITAGAENAVIQCKDGTQVVISDSSSISDYAKPCVNWAGHHEIMTGNDKGSFLPDGTATIAETASVLMRISQIS